MTSNDAKGTGRVAKLGITSRVWGYEIQRGDDVLGVLIREWLTDGGAMTLGNVAYAWLPGVTLDDLSTSLGTG